MIFSIGFDVSPLYLRVALLLPGEDRRYPRRLYLESLDKTIYLLQFDRYDINSIRSHPLLDLALEGRSVPITGTKEREYHSWLSSELGMEVCSIHAHSCIIEGINFFSHNFPFEFFQYSSDSQESSLQMTPEALYPYLVLNIRSGSSIYRVNAQDDFKSIGGSPIGASTIWAIMKKTTKSFAKPSEALEASLNGVNQNVDITVGDIYGGDYVKMGLKADIIASVFGKFQTKLRNNSADEDFQIASDSDISRSLIVMLVYNTSQLAYLYSRIENVRNVILIGNDATSDFFLQKAQESVTFHSKGQANLIFMRYGAFVGAIGALCKDFASSSVR